MTCTAYINDYTAELSIFDNDAGESVTIAAVDVRDIMPDKVAWNTGRADLGDPMNEEWDEEYVCNLPREDWEMEAEQSVREWADRLGHDVEQVIFE